MPLIYNLASQLKHSGSAAFKSRSINDKEIQLEVFDPKPYYTSGDILEGTLTINFREAISVSSINVKLKCDIYTRVFYDSASQKVSQSHDSYRIADVRRKDADIHMSNSHDQVYRTEVRVFPTPDLEESNAKGYTIAPGPHKYEFRIQFPYPTNRKEIYPPTISREPVGPEGGFFRCEHKLKVTVQRTSAFASNQRLEKTLVYQPPFDVEQFQRSTLQPISEAFTLDGGLTVDLQAVIPKIGLPQGSVPIPLQLAAKASQRIVVRNIYVRLDCKTQWISRNVKRIRYATEEDTTIVLGKTSVNRSGSVFDLTEHVHNLCINDFITPTFRQSLLNVSYILVIGVSIGAPDTVFGNQLLELKAPVRILPPPNVASNHGNNRHFYNGYQPPPESPLAHDSTGNMSGSTSQYSFSSQAPEYTNPPPVHYDLPPPTDEKAYNEAVADLKSGQSERPYLPAYQQ